MQRTPVSLSDRAFWRTAALVLTVAVLWRLVVLASGTVSFHSDEAIVGLMARHINQGLPIPTFFYGQPYMGSLDPLLVSLVFRVTGETIVGIRLVQLALYLGFVLSVMALAWRLTGQSAVTRWAGLLIALGSPLLTVYTTISLGGYGETLLLGNLLLLAAWDIHQRRSTMLLLWGLLGAFAGLGWWTNSLIVVYALPAGLWLLSALRRDDLPRIGFAAVAFVLFSAPWWIYNLNHDWESVRFLIGGFRSVNEVSVSMADKAVGLLLIGLPGLTGSRFPATPALWSPLGWVAVAVWIGLLVPRASAALHGDSAARFLWLIMMCFSLIFVLSGFGVDATGRYLLPLVTPLVILVGMAARTRLMMVALAALLVWQTAGTLTAMQSGALTPQFDPITDIPNTHDVELITFLRDNNLTRGYATYWVAYRVAFLSGESIILAPHLPYKSDLRPVTTDRYPLYSAVVSEATRICYVTGNHPALNAALEAAFRVQRLSGWQTHHIGDYTVYYGFDQPVTPESLGLYSASAGAP